MKSVPIPRIVLNHLLSHRDSVANIANHPARGVYGVFAKARDCLPDILLPPTGMIYVGLSKDLVQRNHFTAKNSGFHSPRRSLGAILYRQLHLKAIPRGSGLSATNCTNFRFTEDGEERLTQWMLKNLEYAIYPCGGDIASLETQLIRESEPPLNLTKWRNPQKQKIAALRKQCRDEASSHISRSR
jgi:hypothetical protein